MKKHSFPKWLPITLVVVMILFVIKAGFFNYKSLVEITTHHSPTLTTIQQMEADAFEGVQEAFSYVLMNDEIEKDEFHEKMEHFDIAAKSFQDIARLQEEQQGVELEAFEAIVAAKAEFVENVDEMFAGYERLKVVPTRTVLAVEDSVDNLTVAMNHLVEIEKQELDEHVEELEYRVIMVMKFMLILLALLLALMLKEYKYKK